MNRIIDLKKLSFFSALCFFLSVVETAIPKPVPFFRLGLANLPVMLSLAYMTRRETTFLIFIKVFLQGIVSGTLFSYIFIFSMAGSLASGFSMMAVYCIFSENKKLISWIGISMCGGFFNNIAQLLCSYFIVFGNSSRYIAPLLLTISFVTSFLIGIVACIFEENSKWLRSLNAPRYEGPAEGSSEPGLCTGDGMSVSEGRNTGKAPIIFFIIALLGIIAVSFSRNVFFVYGLFVIFVCIVFLKKKKVRLVPSLIIILSVTALSLLSPYGKILWTIGNFRITQGALESGLLRSGKLCAMVFMSQSAVDKNLKLPGKFGSFMETVFVTVSELTSKKIEKGSARNLISAVDEILIEVWEK